MINQDEVIGRRSVRDVVRRHPATVFVLLAFALSWSVWVPRALVSQGLLAARWPMVLGAYWATSQLTTSPFGLRALPSLIHRWVTAGLPSKS